MSYVSIVKTIGKTSIETTISFDNDATLAEFLYLILDEPDEAEVKEEQKSPLDVVITAIAEYEQRHNRRPSSMQLSLTLLRKVTDQLQILEWNEHSTIFGVLVDQKSCHPDLYIELEGQP